jgi:PIN domain nuclease of toxin-antitoxin system
MNLVYDSCALIAYLEDEPGAEEMETLLSDGSNTGFVHAINLCEIFYHVRRTHGEDAAQAAYGAILKLRLSIREDMDEGLWQHAARLKADYRRVSLADCICASLADRVVGQMVTCDRHEIEALVATGACKATFIG